MTNEAFIEEFARSLDASTDTWRGVPEPTEELGALYATVAAMKEVLEQLARGRGNVANSALLVKDAQALLQVSTHLSGTNGSGGTTGPTGVGIEDITIDEMGDLIVTLTNGSTINAGSLSDAQGQDYFAEYINTLTPLAVPEMTWVTLTNNGEGASHTSYLPAGVDRLLDPATGALDFTGLVPGDGVIVRPSYVPLPSVNNTLVKFRYLLGSGASAYTLERTLGRLDSGSGVGYIQDLLVDYIPMLDTNTTENPVTMQVWLSETGTVTNNGVTLQVIKR
jgi:hypothetical protein